MLETRNFDPIAPPLHLNAPYASSLATLASISSQSILSDSSSQASDDSTYTSATSVSSSSSSNSDSCDSYRYPSNTSVSHAQDAYNHQSVAFSSPHGKQTTTSLPQGVEAPQLPVHTSSNPRRTGLRPTTRTGCPPRLTKQVDRKLNFVDGLIDSATQIVETIWPLSSVACKSDPGNKGVLPLRTFIQETLRRSRTSYSTLQVALYYLVLIKPRVPSRDFTMEQPDDLHANRVLQCGRRMFLSALILASKYLQDRNYSARAWSRISGLKTQEINQNEMAFLFAVDWKLHITDEVFQRWTEIVINLTTPGSQVPPSAASLGLDWKKVIQKINPELDNIEGLLSVSPKPASDVASSPCRQAFVYTDGSECHPARSWSAPSVLEPQVNTTRYAPPLGLLPTPRPTPQSSAYNTPAVSATSLLLPRPSMAKALSQVNSASAVNTMDRWSRSTMSSPCYAPRRSSLATSVSTTSSPESMISDTSATSRSSSVSSISSLAYAPSKLDVQARCRYAKMRSESFLRPAIAPVPEEYGSIGITSSPESYDGFCTKDVTSSEIDDALGAARALQSMHYAGVSIPTPTHSPHRPSLKRSRSDTLEDSVQGRVRSLLRDGVNCDPVWSNSLVPERRTLGRERSIQIPVESPVNSSSKRLCCSAEAIQGYPRFSLLHPAVGGPGGPGMWKGILD